MSAEVPGFQRLINNPDDVKACISPLNMLLYLSTVSTSTTQTVPYLNRLAGLVFGQLNLGQHKVPSVLAVQDLRLCVHLRQERQRSSSYSTCNCFRSVHPKDREADPVLQGLHPGDETRAVPHSDCCVPLHHCRHSGKFVRRALPQTRHSAWQWTEEVLDRDAQCWSDQCRGAPTQRSCFNSSAAQSGWRSRLWRVGSFGSFRRRLTLAKFCVGCVSVYFRALISEEASLVIRLTPGVGIDGRTTSSAASSGDFFSGLQAECQATVLSRQVETDDWCFISDFCSLYRVTSFSSAPMPPTWGITFRILCWPSWWVHLVRPQRFLNKIT